jgi:hypothetical protein
MILIVGTGHPDSSAIRRPHLRRLARWKSSGGGVVASSESGIDNLNQAHRSNTNAASFWTGVPHPSSALLPKIDFLLDTHKPATQLITGPVCAPVSCSCDAPSASPFFDPGQ